jgi:hypothetical protein
MAAVAGVGGDDDLGFTLDDDFIAGATVVEPNWKQREREGKRRRRRVRRKRMLRQLRIPFVVLLFALACGVGFGFVGQGPLASLKRDDPFAGAPGVTGSIPPNGTTGTTTYHLTERNYETGECVRWDQTAGIGDLHTTDIVGCDEPHLIEMTSRVAMTDAYDHYPTKEEWFSFIHRECVAPAESLLGTKLDPYGRFFISAIRPSAESWPNGDRDVWCGLAANPVDASEAADGNLVLFTGKIEGQGQQNLLPAGTCIDDRSRATPCTEPHVAEIVAHVDLTGRVTDPPPANDTAAWNALVADDCGPALRAYLGHEPDENTSWGWHPIASESWAAGSHLVTCTAGRVLVRGGGWVTVTAPLRPTP